MDSCRRIPWFYASFSTASCGFPSIPIFSCCGASFSWRFSCRCLALNWPYLTWGRFGCFKSSLFFLLTSSPNCSRHRLWTISQNALSCFAVDPLRRIVMVVESSWSSRAQAELWFPLGHWILTLPGNALGCAGAAMGSVTLWWLSGFEIPSFDLFSILWICSSRDHFCQSATKREDDLSWNNDAYRDSKLTINCILPRSYWP